MGSLKRVLSPGNRLFFVLMVAFAGASAYFSITVAAAEGALIVIAALIYRRQIIKRRSDIVKYIDQLTTNVDSAAQDSVVNCPIPMLILRMETGELIWANDGFMEISGLKEGLFSHRIGDVLPDFSLKWLSMPGTSANAELRGRTYSVSGSVVRPSGKNRSGPLATLYFIDTTELSELRNDYKMSRPVVILLVMDNYDECVKNFSDSQKSAVLAAAEEKISEWTAPLDGVVRKFDRDKYLLVFESRQMEALVEGRFAILDNIRAVVGAANMPVTLSIGVGRDGDTLGETFSYAQLAIDMALSRGGDQAVIKNRYAFDFFGGRSKEADVRTKVKSRVVAASLARFIQDSSMVLVMGHAYSDIDSLGAAAGVACIARKCGVRVHIVIDAQKTMAAALLRKLRACKEYDGVFIDEQAALLIADNRTLMVVVDCNRPEIVESEELLRSMNHVAVIDHHRRSANYIENAVLMMHEPSASSACELVCELTRYTCQPGDLLRCEAEAMMAGIVLDTKSFTMHTGMNTFEAAAFLRGCGADPIEIKKYFQNDMRSSMERYELISGAKILRDGIAVASGEVSDRAVAAQAADEMLNIAGIDASFVLFRSGDETIISGRSLGDVNVQMILEKLGGGGHRAIAGAQLKGVDAETALGMLTEAIDAYCDENGFGGIPPQAL